jgi:hypothetical protein
MPLIKPGDIILHKPRDESDNSCSNPPASVMVTDAGDHVFTGTPLEILKKHIGQIDFCKTTHFVTSGRWSMNDLMIYVLQQTGPADVMVATWSIAETAMRQILNNYQQGLIKSISFLLDPRVKVRNPKPLQLLSANFPYRLFRCHAKVTLIRSAEHHISIVSSANMTQNPRIERGVIFPYKEIYDFDYKWLYETINQR